MNERRFNLIIGKRCCLHKAHHTIPRPPFDVRYILVSGVLAYAIVQLCLSSFPGPAIPYSIDNLPIPKYWHVLLAFIYLSILNTIPLPMEHDDNVLVCLPDVSFIFPLPAARQLTMQKLVKIHNIFRIHFHSVRKCRAHIHQLF